MSRRASRWPWALGAATAGFTVGVIALAGGSLLLYSAQGFLHSAGFLIALTLGSLAAGLWVGVPAGAPPGQRATLTRWMFAVGAVVIASFVASAWLRLPAVQTLDLARPIALVLLLAEPAYAVGALLAALAARDRARPGRRAGVAVAALLGAAVGAGLAAVWLIPSFPPGPVFLAVALVLATAGSVEMALGRDAREGSMSERVVIITGVGGRGQVGFAVAEAFVRQGARVLVTGRTDAVESHARDLGEAVVPVVADLATEAGAAEVVDTASRLWARLDVLVNVAGGLHVMKPLGDTTPDEWQGEHDANARTAFLVSRAALPLLRQSGGTIINFAAPAGERAVKGLGAYSAAKAGVVALTRAMALEEKEHGVRVNAIAPGLLDTEENRAGVEDPDARPWVTLAELTSAVLFLAGPDGSGINGEIVHVEGRTLR